MGLIWQFNRLAALALNGSRSVALRPKQTSAGCQTQSASAFALREDESQSSDYFCIELTRTLVAGAA